MTRVGWLADDTDMPGGAEYTEAEFRAAAPDDVEIVLCFAGEVDYTCEKFVVQNCVKYTADEIARVTTKPTVKYWNDVGRHLQPGVMGALHGVTHVCCSPIQSEYMGIDAACIPPPVDLARFELAAAEVNGNRAGIVSVGSWRNYGKAPHKAAEWAARDGSSIDFVGGGPFAPRGSQQVDYDGMPALLARYERFVFLPMVIEPFGRVVAEAWAAGCEVITNQLVGAKYWIEENPDAIDTAAEDFWKLVLA